MNGEPLRMLLVHQFELPRISGLTISVGELQRLIPEVDPRVTASSLSYEGAPEPADLVRVLDREHREVNSVVGLNLHIEAGWEHSLALAGWCDGHGVPLVLHVHDYWPHHRQAVATLTARFGALLLAITPAIVADLAVDGFAALLVPAGVAVPAWPAVSTPPFPPPPTVAAVGRLVPRKRFADVVTGFCRAGTPPGSRLYLRLPPSLVFPGQQDSERLEEIAAIAAGARGRPVVLDTQPVRGTDYTRWALYISASEYEGVSMTPLESILQGCPFLLSDIPPHRAIAEALFPDQPEDVLFPVGDVDALAVLIEHELRTGERQAQARANAPQIRRIIERSWSLRVTAERLVELTRGELYQSSGAVPSADRG
jgi:glycosyltransferase involved in cell wall biosynthesis